jgi:beta-1,4-mannooligosaccharide/beta-1,4-mannosyl-N-acetylglucosamine phosphorylase
MEKLIQRHHANPILRACDIPYAATLIFNAGVAKWQGKYVMVFRNDYGGVQGSAHFEGTNIGVAVSDDGVSWQPRSEPWIEWKDEEIRRAYDPRITVLDGRCYLCFAVDTAHGVRGGIAVTDDLQKRHSWCHTRERSWIPPRGRCSRPAASIHSPRVALPLRFAVPSAST